MKKRIEELDVLRGIAALSVVLFHLSVLSPSYRFFLKWGVEGVDLFFIISGFVIFMTLQHVQQGKEFVVNRFTRLYPTYWASVSFSFAAILFIAFRTGDVDFLPLLGKYLANMTMFQEYMGIKNLEGSYWTLLIEMLFYILIFTLYMARILKWILPIFASLCLISVALVYILPPAKLHFYFYLFPLGQFIPLFLAGIVFYHLYTKKGNQFLHYSLLLFCLIAQLILFPYVGRSKDVLTLYEYAPLLIVFFLLFTLFVHHKLRFIICKPLLFLGKISFPLYLIHQYFSINILMGVFHFKWHLNFGVSILLSLPILIGIAYFITYFIEIRLSKQWRKKLLQPY